MRKGILLSAIVVLLVLGTITTASAQKTYSADGTGYVNAIGLGIDFGDGSTLVGFSGKHFFTANHVGSAEILFGDHVTALQAFYQYHKEFDGAPGLRWYAGVGPAIFLYNHYSDFAIRPIGGLDYKITNVPLSLSFDWRPAFTLTHGSDFTAARFGLGFRYSFN